MKRFALAIAMALPVLAGCMQTTGEETVVPLPATETVATTAAMPPGTGAAALLSQIRAENGLGPLTEDPRLTAAAQRYAQVMASTGHFSHTGPNGSTFAQRARAAGYGCPAAENIAFGTMTEAQVIANWMTSAGHRRNILKRDVSEFGLGHAGDKWVLVLGRGC